MNKLLALTIVVSVLSGVPSFALQDSESLVTLTVEPADGVRFRVASVGTGVALHVEEYEEGFSRAIPSGERRLWLFQALDPRHIIPFELVSGDTTLKGGANTFLVSLDPEGKVAMHSLDDGGDRDESPRELAEREMIHEWHLRSR